MRQKKKTKKTLRKAGMYRVRRMIQGRRQRMNFQRGGREPAKYDMEVKGGKCYILPTC